MGVLVAKSVMRITSMVVLEYQREIQSGFLTVKMRRLWTKWAMTGG